jgi:[protein-PII] uridylyltransferase
VAGANSTIVEIRAGDRAGLLYRLTTALADLGLDVTSARIETLGADALDSFYVCDPRGTAMDAELRRRVELALRAAAGGLPSDPVVGSKRDTPG